MAHFDITKNSIISNVLIGFSFYFLSCLNLFYPNVTFLLLTIFFLISLIVHIFNKARKSLFSDLFFIVINAFVTYFHFKYTENFHFKPMALSPESFSCLEISRSTNLFFLQNANSPKSKESKSTMK